MKNSILREPTSTNPTGLSFSQEQYWSEQSIWQDKVWSVLSHGECRKIYQHIPDLFLRHILIGYVSYPDCGKDLFEFSTRMGGMVTCRLMEWAGTTDHCWTEFQSCTSRWRSVNLPYSEAPWEPLSIGIKAHFCTIILSANPPLTLLLCAWPSDTALLSGSWVYHVDCMPDLLHTLVFSEHSFPHSPPFNKPSPTFIKLAFSSAFSQNFTYILFHLI